MRELHGRKFYLIQTYSAAAVALCSVPEYKAHRESNLPRRHDGRPGEKLLHWSHCQGLGTVRLTKDTAKAAGTTVESLKKAYPPSWYLADNRGVWVVFPKEIRFGEDLPVFDYGQGVA